MSTRPIAKFNCKQTELITVCRIGLASYRESQPVLEAFKGKYTVAWGDDFEAEIAGVRGMRDYQARNARAEVLKIRLDAKNKEVCEKWQGLKLYIADVPAWANEQKPRLEAAGWNYYEKALKGNWDSTMAMISSANLFMSTNSAVLVTPDNMPAAFVTQFATLGTEFNDLFDEFEDANQDSDVETDARLNKMNTLHERLMGMFADGFHVHRNNPALQERFIFSSVLELVRGASTPIKTFKIDPNSAKVIKRIVANSKITNSGAVVVVVSTGVVTTPAPDAVTLNPEDEMTAPGSEVTVFNNEASEAQVDARVVVD